MFHDTKRSSCDSSGADRRGVTWTTAALALFALACAGDEGRGGGVPEQESGGDGSSARAEGADSSAPPDTSAASYSFPPLTGEDPRILIQDTHLRVTPSSSLHVVELHGRLERLQEAPAYFDVPSSFAIRVDTASVAVTGPDLAALMNEHVFAYEGAPLSDLRVEIRDERIYQEGTVEKIVPIPFSMVARVEGTDEGDIVLVPEEMETAGVPVDGLMDLLGVELAQVLETEEARGVRIVEDRLVLDPEVLVPPPHLRGRVGSVSLAGDLLEMDLVRSEGDASPDDPLRPPQPDAPHFLFFRGGEVRFDKLTMRATDLQIIDADPDDPFDFYLDRLQEQLVAGSSSTLPDEGLLVRVPDYDDLEP